MTGIWGEIDRWSRAIGDVVYTSESEGSPVYLDMDQDSFERIAKERRSNDEDGGGGNGPSAIAGVLGEDDSRVDLIRCVRQTLQFHEGNVLKAYLSRTATWLGSDNLDPPPALPLLSVLTIAAEQMEATTKFAANNYYGRLTQLLELNEEQGQQVKQSYRVKKFKEVPSSEYLWNSLNVWLERWEGLRGLPTAYPFSHRHIGYPRLQALVRSHDRVVLGRFFADCDLPPQGVLLPEDLTPLFDEWVNQEPCPSMGLRGIWGIDRETLAEIACQELAAWEGSTESDGPGGTRIGKLQLTASLQRFPSPRLELSLIDGMSTDNVDLKIIGRDDSIDPIPFIPNVNGRLVPANPGGISRESLLAGMVKLQNPLTGAEMQRLPRRLVPLRKDELLQTFVETDRAGLVEETMLLCRSEIATAVAEFLSTAAQVGYRHEEQIDGLPDNWELFSGVRILTGVDDPRQLIPDELSCLVPNASLLLLPDKGFRLPVRIPTWSSLEVPEIRASSLRGNGLKLKISPSQVFAGDQFDTREFTSDAPVLIADLAELDLPEGVFRLELFGGNSDRPAQTSTLRLRSANHPARIGADRFTLGHQVEEISSSILGATDCDPEGNIRGSLLDVHGTGGPFGELASITPNWYQGRHGHLDPEPLEGLSGSRELIELGDVEYADCFRNGAHHWLLPTIMPGKKPTTIDGKCKKCGQFKKFPARYRFGAAAKSKKETTATAAPVFDIASVDPISVGSDLDRQLDVALDALCFAQQGTSGALERTASQIDPGRVFVDGFERALSLLGHVELERDPATMRVTRWDITPPTLSERTNGGYFLTGFRSLRMLEELKQHVNAQGGTVSVKSQGKSFGPSVVLVEGIDEEGASAVAAQLPGAPGHRVAVQPEAARALTAVLPPLSAVADCLVANHPLPAAQKVECWDPKTVCWNPVHSSNSAGYYRLYSHRPWYVIRTAENIDNGQVTIANSRVIKHVAALREGEPLVGYDCEKEVLYMPIGADLPGLYGRAAVLASGFLPVIAQDVLTYRHIPPDLAFALMSGLNS
jgi:hypothetical protein